MVRMKSPTIFILLRVSFKAINLPSLHREAVKRDLEGKNPAVISVQIALEY